MVLAWAAVVVEPCHAAAAAAAWFVRIPVESCWHCCRAVVPPCFVTCHLALLIEIVAAVHIVGCQALFAATADQNLHNSEESIVLLEHPFAIVELVGFAGTFEGDPYWKNHSMNCSQKKQKFVPACCSYQMVADTSIATWKKSAYCQQADYMMSVLSCSSVALVLAVAEESAVVAEKLAAVVELAGTIAVDSWIVHSWFVLDCIDLKELVGSLGQLEQVQVLRIASFEVGSHRAAKTLMLV